MTQTIISTAVYTFDELSDDAKQRARDWFLSSGDESTIAFDRICEDAQRIGLRIVSLSDRRTNQGDFDELAHLVAVKIMQEHGATCDTYKTAKEFLGKLIDIDTQEEEAQDDMNDFEAARDEITSEFLQALLENYRVMLEKEIEYQQSNEVVDENIEANGYTFTKDGKRFG